MFVLGLANVHLCFHQKAGPQLQVGVELDVNPRMQESVATIAYQVDLPKADLVFKGLSIIKIFFLNCTSIYSLLYQLDS